MRKGKRLEIGTLRRGASSLDAILVLGVILPLVLFLFFVVPRMIQLVYEMTVVLVNSPLL